MWIKKLIVFIEKWGLVFLVFCLLTVFGFAVHEGIKPKEGAEAISVWTSIVDTLTSDSEKAEGWAQVMHLLFNATLAWAGIRVYMATAGLKWDNFLARYMVRSHVIIIAGKSEENSFPNSARQSSNTAGLEVDKSALAIELALSMAASNQVVLNLKSVDESNRTKLWEAGVTLLTKDLIMADVLTATGAQRASMLIAMRDHYGDNVALTRLAFSPKTDNPGLECKCLIEPLSMKRTFRLEDYFENDSLPRIRIFNEAELIARRILQKYPPDLPVARSDEAGVHLILVGLGSVGQSILLQLARLGHYRSGKQPKVTVIDRNVKQQWREMLDAYPQLMSLVQVETQELIIEEIREDNVDRWLFDERPVTMVYACTKDEIANLRFARLLLNRLQARDANNDLIMPQVVALDPPGGSVLNDYLVHGQHNGCFQVFSLVQSDLQNQDASSIEESHLISEVDDSRARQFHEDYCAKDRLACEKEPGRQPAPFNRAWTELPETARNANRITADHFEVKMRALGYSVVSKEVLSEPLVLQPEQLELLARMEHDRWWADRILDGWTFNAVRNNQRKFHPNLVPYVELTETIKQLDRDSVLQMIEILDSEGYVIAGSN
jgi:hypothetical protein